MTIYGQSGMRRFISSVLLLLSSFPSIAQQARGGEADVSAIAGGSGSIRAIIAGVSNYQYLDSSLYLTYADDDATSIFEALQNHPKVDPNNVRSFLNEKATKANFLSALNEVVLASQENDVVIVFFAGHGNIQKAGLKQGFLLFHDATPRSTDYFADRGCLKLTDLQDYGTECAQRGIKFIMIIDACHSGKVLDDDGARSTLSVLNAQWENIAKLISCQGNQFSLEDPALGHGVFTYFLLQGLEKSDTDNEIVELGELRSFLENEVRKYTKNKQIPSVVGSYEFPIMPKAKTTQVLATARDAKKTPVQKRSDRSGNFDSLLSTPEGSLLRSVLDSKRLVRNRWDGKPTIKVGEVRKERLTNEVIKSVTESPDGSALAITVGDALSIKVIDAKTKASTALSASGGAYALKFTPDGRHLVASLRNNSLALFDWRKGQLVQSKSISKGGSKRLLAVSNGGDKLIACDEAGSISILSLPDLTLLKHIERAHTGKISNIAIAGNDSIFVTGSDDKTVKIWKLSSGSLLHTLSNHKEAVKGVCIDAFNQLYSGDGGGKVIKWSNLNNPKPVLSAQTGVHINDLNLDRTGSMVFVSGRHYHIEVVESDSLKLKASFVHSRNGLPEVMISADNKKMYALNSGGDLMAADIEVGNYYADYLYSRFTQNPRAENYRSDLSVEYVAELLNEVDAVTQAFILGKDVLPSAIEIQKALIYIDKIRELNASNSTIANIVLPLRHYLKAMLVIQTNDFPKFDAALKDLEEIYKYQLNATYPKNAAGIIYKKRAEMELAKQKIGEAALALPKWTEPKNNQGKALLDEFKFEEAALRFEEIKKLEPKDTKGYKSMAELYMRKGAYVKALTELRTAIRMDSRNALLHANLARVLQECGDLNQANTSFRKALELNESSAEVHLLYAKFLFDLYRHQIRDRQLVEDAFSHLTRAIAIDPNDPAAYQAGIEFNVILKNIATEEQLGALEMLPYDNFSEKYLNKLFELAPFDGKNYVLKALLEFKNNDKTKSESSIAIMRNNAKVLNKDFWLGVYFAETGNNKSAEGYFRNVLKQNPARTDAIVELVRMARMNNNINAMKEWVEATKASKSNSEELMLEVAMGAAQFAELNQETKFFAEQVVKLNPENQVAKNIIRNMRGASYDEHLELGVIQSSRKVQQLGAGSLLVRNAQGNYLAGLSNQLVMKIPYDEVASFMPGFLQIKAGSSFGVIRSNGAVVVPVQFDEVKSVDGLIQCRLGKKLGLYHPDGKVILEVDADEVEFYEDFITFKKNNLWGAVNRSGRVIVLPNYQSVKPATYRLKKSIRVERKGLIQYLSFDGKCISC